MKKIYKSDFQPAYLNKLLLFILTGLLVSSAAFSQTASINDPGLTETNLDAQSVTITLGGGESFIDATLVSSNFTLNNAPSGLTIQSFTSVGLTSAVVNFAFTPGDFDLSIPNFSISIDHTELTVTAAGVLTTNAIPISANIESATLTPATVSEAGLNGQVLTVTLSNEQFVASINPNNFYLVNAPAGLSIANVVRTAPTVASVTLLFSGDFDADITNFAVRISPSQLIYTSDIDLVTNSITLVATVENPVATLAASPPLSEYSLNGRLVSISLVDESFGNPGALVPGNFTPASAPPGLSIQSISGTPTSTYIELVLGFDLTDFDIDYNNFHILIDDIVLTQSSADLATSRVSITYGLEPVITNVSIPNETMRIGSVVQVTISVEDDEGNDFTLEPGAVIGGYALSGLSRIDATTYSSSFTVEEGGLDYPASQDIHVRDLQLNNGAIPGELITLTYISQDADLLDANAPEIRYIYTNTDGPQNVGSEIYLWIQADENGLSFDPASQVNGIAITEPSIEITESGGGRYRLQYVVAEGDNPVDPGELVVSMTALDEAGNGSNQGSIDPNNLSIDASTPVILNAYVSSTDDDIIVGETIEIVVNADQAGYRNDDLSTWINGVYLEPLHLTFTDLGGGSYQYAYTVQEEDGAVARGDLAINIVLLDAAPFTNASPPFADLNPNDVQITTSRPSASISGPSEICEGDSALLTVVLGGTAPWTIDVFDGTSTVQYLAAASPYTFWVYPEVSTDYTITRVVDGTGLDNTGSGIVSITVHQLPDVQITNLQGMYDVASPDVLLEYTPPGGTFTGPGITASPWTFDPGAAGISGENSPHEIVYSYTDAGTGCTSSDIQEVIVVSGSGFITLEKDVACFSDETFLITGSNIYGTTGSFTITPTPPAGAFQDQGDNTAILRPNVYVLSDDLVLRIDYRFEDLGGTDIIVPRDLTIEYLEDAVIYEPPSLELCQNEELIALDGNYNEMVTGYTFTSPGRGVVQDSVGNYLFDPAQADTGVNRVLYEYISPNQCQVSDSVDFIVNDAPDAGFIVVEPCISLQGGGLVQFESRSDTVSVRWLWGFGDPESGLNNNRSILENPTHHYDDTGSYAVSLSVSNDHCDEQVVKVINIYPSPQADFSFNSSCMTDAPIIMTGEETVILPDTVSNWSWKIDSAGIEILRLDTSISQLSYSFASEGTTYSVRYKIVTSALCSEEIDKEITLSPTIMLSPDSPYSEDFELDEHGWELGPISTQNSWTDTVVNPAEFPITAASGTRAWYTDRPEVATPENSWVLSPCFSFADTFSRPMVSMDIKRSLDRDKDGAALQYTINNGVTWKNVGDVDDGGLEWYNINNLIPYVGNQKTGWSGELLPGEDPEWYEAAHGLDNLVGKQEVRFRVAYGSFGGTRTEMNDGFAFDNFTIRQRTRLSVLEYFTNANTALCAETDTVIMEIMNEVPADVIDIQYHAKGSQADEFYDENAVPAENRGSIYELPAIPYAILDGGINMDEMGHPMVYNFNSGSYPNVEDIRLRSLMDPDFNLTITVTQYTPTLEFTVELEANKNLVRKERSLYGIVLERRVDDPLYWGTNGITVFRHVARKILPDAAGYYFIKEWNAGEIEYRDFSYPSPFFATSKDSITIAVFMQDDETNEILQATTNPGYVTSTFDEIAPPSQVLIYPNPARDLVNIYFEESPVEEMQFTLYDLSGKIVITDVIGPWQQQFTRSLDDLEQGIYIVEIRSRDRRRVIHRDKLLHY